MAKSKTPADDAADAVEAFTQPPAQSVRMLDLKYSKETKQHWVYEVTFNDIAVGSCYLPKILMGGTNPGDRLAAAISRKP